MFVAGRLYEQQHTYIYMQMFLIVVGPLFRVIMILTKKQINDNLKHLHAYIYALVHIACQQQT